MASINSTSSFRVSLGSGSQNHTVLAGDRRGMYFLITQQDSNHGNYPIVSCKFNGQNATRLTSVDAGAGNNVGCEIWYLADPTVTTGLVEVTATGVLGDMVVFVICLNDQDGSEALNTATGTGTSASLSISSLTDGAYILSVVAAEGTLSSPGSGQTLLGPLTDQSFENAAASYESKATAGADTQSFTVGTSQDWAMASVVVKPYVAPNVEAEAVTAQDANRTKKYAVLRFYTPTGEYVTSLTEKDFKNLPEFTWDINGGHSELRLEAAFAYEDWKYPPDGLLTERTGGVPPEDFAGETVQTVRGVGRIYDALKVGNKMKMTIIDKEGEVQVWSGIYTGMELEFSKGMQSVFTHNFISNFSRLSSILYRDGSATTVTHTSVDPADMFRDIIDTTGAGLTYSEDTLNDTDTTRSYVFKALTASEALATAIKLTPSRWVYFVGGDDSLYLRNIDTHATTHRIPLQKCLSVRFQKAISFIRNRVVFLGGGSPQLYEQYDSEGSQNQYGVWEERLADEQVEDSETAGVLSRRFLTDRQSPTNYFTVEVADSNFNSHGFDIESVKPGDEIIITSDTGDYAFNIWGAFVWGVDKWKYNFYATTGIPGVVQRIVYRYDSAVFECSFNFDKQIERIEEVSRDLTDYRFKDAPDEPDVQ